MTKLHNLSTFHRHGNSTSPQQQRNVATTTACFHSNRKAQRADQLAAGRWNQNTHMKKSSPLNGKTKQKQRLATASLPSKLIPKTSPDIPSQQITVTKFHNLSMLVSTKKQNNDKSVVAIQTRCQNLTWYSISMDCWDQITSNDYRTRTFP